MISSLWKSALLLQKLRGLGVELIYFDEFSLSTRHFTYRGWNQKGNKGFLLEDGDLFSISIIIAFSHKFIYEWMANSETMNSKWVKYFYSVICKTRKLINPNKKDGPIFVGDNAKIHKSKETESFLKDTNCRLLTITPYSPWLNPAEYFIGAVKNKLKEKLIRGS